MLKPGHLLTVKEVEDLLFSGPMEVGSRTYDAPDNLYFNAVYIGASDGEAMSPEQVTKQLAKLGLRLVEKEAVEAMVDDLLKNLKGRKGLGQAFESCDDDVQDEIKETWTGVIWDSLGNG